MTNHMPHIAGGKRKVNKSLKAWVAFVKKVQKEEKLSYKDAIHRAKVRKDKGEKWMSGGANTPNMEEETIVENYVTPTMEEETIVENYVTPTMEEESDKTVSMGGKRRHRTMRRSRGRGKGRTARRARGRASRRH